MFEETKEASVRRRRIRVAKSGRYGNVAKAGPRVMHTFRLTKRKAAVSIMGAGGVAEEGQEWLRRDRSGERGE